VNPTQAARPTGRDDSQATRPLPPRPDLAMPPGARPAAAPSARRPAPSRGRDPYADPYTSGIDEDVEGAWLVDSRSGEPDPLDPNAWDYDFLLEPEERPSGREEFLIEEWEEDAPPPPSRSRPGARARAPRPPSVGIPNVSIGLPAFRMPSSAVGSDILADPVSLGLLAANLVGVLLMAMVLAVTSGRMPDVFVQHLDAAGIADRWGTARVLWRIPLLSLAIALINAVLAWWLAPRDRFASRFLLGAALFVQLIAWIALFDFV